jgi:hypothetical protein
MNQVSVDEGRKPKLELRPAHKAIFDQTLFTSYVTTFGNLTEDISVLERALEKQGGKTVDTIRLSIDVIKLRMRLLDAELDEVKLKIRKAREEANQI